MKVNGRLYRSIWLEEDGKVGIIDQRFLPHRFVLEWINSASHMQIAIKEMHLRGAIVIGVSGAYGVYLAAKESEGNIERFNELVEKVRSARPTAVNLSWAVERVLSRIKMEDAGRWDDVVELCREEANKIWEEELLRSKRIGEVGVKIIEEVFKRKQDTVQILTHCNAGWLACVDYGTATAPIYEAYARGIPVHVWVDETRPRNQGARLTAWELLNQGISHTIIADNTGGLLMQRGMVDLVIVGADRVSRRGDVANKIGTYLKALAARDNGVPFYVALPSSTFDLSLCNGLDEIPIEERDPDEVRFIQGLTEEGEIKRVLLTPRDSSALNYAFDVTPFNLITGLITEKGIIPAREDAIVGLLKEDV